MRSFLKMVSAVLVLAMLMSTLSIGAFADASSTQTVTQSAKEVSVDSYYYRYTFDSLAVDKTFGSLQNASDPNSNPYNMTTGGTLNGAIKSHGEGLGNYYSVDYINRYQEVSFYLIDGETNHSIANGIDISFKLRWVGQAQTLASTAEMNLLLYRRAKTSGRYDIPMLIARVDAEKDNLVILAARKNGTKTEYVEIYRIAKASETNNSFTSFNVVYHDVTNSYSVYINGTPYVEGATCVVDPRGTDTVTTTYDADFAPTRTQVSGADSSIESLRLFSIRSGNERNQFNIDVDDLIIKDGDYYANSFETAGTGLNTFVQTTVANNTVFTIDKGSASITDDGNATNKYLSLNAGRLKLSDGKYQFLENGNWTVDFKLQASGASPILRLFDRMKERTLLVVDGSGRLTLGSDTIPNVTVPATGSSEWVRITLSIVVDDTNKGVFDNFINYNGASKNNYRVALWVDGKYVSTTTVDRIESSADSTGYNYWLLNDRFVTVIPLASAPDVTGMTLISDNDGIKTYIDTNEDYYQVEYSGESFVAAVKIMNVTSAKITAQPDISGMSFLYENEDGTVKAYEANDGNIYQLVYEGGAFKSGLKLTPSIRNYNDNSLYFFNGAAGTTGAIDDLSIYKGIGPKEYAVGEFSENGVISNIDFESISVKSEHIMAENVYGTSGGNSYVVASNANKDFKKSGNYVNATYNGSGESFFDLRATNAGGKAFSATWVVKNVSVENDMEIFKLYRQAEDSSAVLSSNIYVEADTSYVYFVKSDVKYYLYNGDGTIVDIANDNWTELEVVFDESNGETLVSFTVNGEATYYANVALSTFAFLFPINKAVSLSGIIDSTLYETRNAVDQRVRFYSAESNAFSFDMLSAEVKYTTAAKAAENIEYKDFAWVDFAEYENITEFKKEFGNQYYISDDVTIENGVLNIPEGATFAWIDANGVFANFLDNSNLGFNVEMMVKTDFVGDGFISVIHDAYKSGMVNLCKNDNQTVFNTPKGGIAGYGIVSTSTEKFTELAITISSLKSELAIFADGNYIGVSRYSSAAPTSGEKNIAFVVEGSTQISELYIHTGLERELAKQNGNLITVSPERMTVGSTDKWANPSIINAGVLAKSDFFSEQSTSDVKYFRLDFKHPNDDIESDTGVLTGHVYSQLYLNNYLEDNITVFEFNLKFTPHSENSNKNMSLLSLRRTEDGYSGSYNEPILYLAPNGNLIYESDVLCDANGEPMQISKDNWTNVAVIYDSVAGQISFRIDGKIPYYNSDNELLLAQQIQLPTPRYYKMTSPDTRAVIFSADVTKSGKEITDRFIGTLDISYVKVYNLDISATSGFVGAQRDTKNNHIRLVAGVDMLYYGKVGFEIEALDAEGNSLSNIARSYMENIVYSSIEETLNGDRRTVYPESYGYRYFYTANIMDVTTEQAVKLNVTPFTVIAGVQYNASTVTIDIDFSNDSMDKWVLDTDSVEIKPEGDNINANFSTTEIVAYTKTDALEFNGLNAKFAFAANLNGGVVSIDLANAFGEATEKSVFDIYVDDFGTPIATLKLDFGHHTITLAKGLKGEHKFMIVKRTGGDFVSINTINICGNLITPPELAVYNAVDVVVKAPINTLPYGNVEVYTKTSASNQNYYIKYRLDYINYTLNDYDYADVNSIENSHNNAQMYRINSAELVKKTEDGYDVIYKLLQGGEISLAIKENHYCTYEELLAKKEEIEYWIETEKAQSNPNTKKLEQWEGVLANINSGTGANIPAIDFIGGWHGDENIEDGQIAMYLDGVKLNLTTAGTYTGTHFIFDQTCLIDRCDEPGNNVMRHSQYMLIDTNGLRNNQSVEFLTADFVPDSGQTYLQMCTFNRRNTSLSESERVLPENYICDEFNILDANGAVLLNKKLDNYNEADGSMHVTAGKQSRYVEYIGNSDNQYGNGLYGKVGFVIDDFSVAANNPSVLVRAGQGDNKWYASFKSYNGATVPLGEKWNISNYYYFDFASNDYIQ